MALPKLEPDLNFDDLSRSVHVANKHWALFSAKPFGGDCPLSRPPPPGKLAAMRHPSQYVLVNQPVTLATVSGNKTLSSDERRHVVLHSECGADVIRTKGIDGSRFRPHSTPTTCLRFDRGKELPADSHSSCAKLHNSHVAVPMQRSRALAGGFHFAHSTRCRLSSRAFPLICHLAWI